MAMLYWLFRFFGKRMRLMWKRLRPAVVRWLRRAMLALVALLLIIYAPELASFLLALGVMITLISYFWRQLF